MIEREAEPFDEKAVEERLKSSQKRETAEECGIYCGSSLERDINKQNDRMQIGVSSTGREKGESEPEAELSHWPVQLHLVNPQARFLQEADLLIAADCVPFAYADFHRKYLAGRSLVIGCPKLDDVSAYHKKLVEIFKNNKLKSITLLHMEVGCCFGLSKLVQTALQEAGAEIQLKEVIIGVDGSVKS